ncbi:MAG: signal recognition particle protein [Alphaproteobacteria bacterium]|nr:signal recognition particle protein [Alphaproteobacteria bacterium]
MFETLTTRLGAIFEQLTRKGALGEADVDAALREVRVALLEADVSLPVVKDFLERVRARAVGQEVVRSVTPGQMVVKIVHDNLVEMLGGSGAVGVNLAASPPVPILMVGLQGSGKTTTSAKLALHLKQKHKKKVLLASLDVRRPAAQEQLAVLGRQAEVASLPVVPGEPPVAIARRAMQTAALEAYDAVILDTAGRLAIDEELMAEAVAVRDAAKPAETLLVADAMTGQDAVNVAKAFHERLGLTGIVLTRTDGDARGGAALSMRAVTGCPIKLVGAGEKLDALEPFHPERVAGRILGMGDVVGLVERAAETIEKEEAERLAKKIEKGQFDLEDMAKQLRQVRQMGGLEGLLGMMPGVQKVKRQIAEAKLDEFLLKRQEAIISSMTKRERKNPDLIKASRRQRIASGSGTSVQDVNKLLKQFFEMQKMMKRVGKLGTKGLMRAGLPGLAPGARPPFLPQR